MNNTRFATSIHILTLLAFEPDEWLSSEYVSGSININPVMVRKELLTLQKAGLVQTKKGKDGGTKLNRPATDILLSEVLEAVSNSDILGRKNLTTNPKCRVGSQINRNLDRVFLQTEQAVQQSLAGQSLADFMKQF